MMITSGRPFAFADKHAERVNYEDYH